MELNDLKSVWNSSSGNYRSESDLLKMTQITNNPSLKKIRRKLIIESIGLTIFLFIYWNAFDGDKKPLYANILLIGSLVLYLLNNVIGYISLQNPIRGNNLSISIENYLIRIKRFSNVSLLISFIYGVSLIAFFLSVINFTPLKTVILAGLIVTLLLMTYLSYQIWRNQIRNLSQQARDFKMEEEVTNNNSIHL